MQIELEPCPFCGSKDVSALFVDEDAFKYAYEGQDVDGDVNPYIHCYGCDSEWFTDSANGDDVIKAWNRRVDDDER